MSTPTSRTLTLLSPAKINVHLRVAGPDPASGYHALRSWMVTVGLHDAIRATLDLTRDAARDADARPDVVAEAGVALHIEGDVALPADASNLVHRAAVALGVARRPLTLELMKRIPSGAGLGGGSGNAATTLLLLDVLLDLGRSRAQLHALAATLGSDVPFFLHAPSAVVTGRGEHVAPAPAPRARAALLLLPPFAIATPAAYRALDELRPVAPADALEPFDVDGWSRLSARDLLPRLHNDLERAAFALEPRLGALRIELERALDRTVRMSGSGSTLFTLYDDPDAAEAAAAVVTRRLAGVRALATAIERDPIDANLPGVSDAGRGFSN